MKAKLMVDLDVETADEIVRSSLYDTILSVRNMLQYYEDKIEGHDGEGVALEYFEKCQRESQRDLEALKHVHNYFAPPEEHID